MNVASSALKITVPEQKLTALSFCEANAKQMEQWVRQLPMANIGETAKQLYHAVMEVNQLIVVPNTRYQLMEILRGPVHYVCKELSKHFLNHSIVLPEKQRKIANLAQALQLHLANGYKLVVHEYLEQGVNDKTLKQLAPACHRVISDLSRCVVRSCQLYCQSPPNVWLEIHQVFRFAHEKGIDRIKVKDSQQSFYEETTVLHAYKRIILLGCSKPNQMRQSDISSVYEASDAWAQHTDIELTDSSAALFMVNPGADAPPFYRSLHSGPPIADPISFDTAELVDRITDYLSHLNQQKRPPEELLEMPVRVSDNVLASLSKALGILTKRSFKRMATNGRVFLTAGLSATHYFSAGSVDFNVLLMRDSEDEDQDANYFLQRAQKTDVWSSSFDSGPSGDRSGADMSPISFKSMSGRSSSESKRNYMQHIVPLVNTSPGGYCIQWSGDVPGNVQAGELLGLREREDQPWSIGVIRWIRQIRQHGTQFGVELLAPNAKPCGVQLTQKTGDSSEFLRGLLLPELPSIGQPATLITPRLPFQVGNKVILNKKGRESKVQLTRRVSATGSFSQFEINFLGQAMQQAQAEVKAASKNNEDDFDSLWPSL